LPSHCSWSWRPEPWPAWPRFVGSHGRNSCRRFEAP